MSVETTEEIQTAASVVPLVAGKVSGPTWPNRSAIAANVVNVSFDRQELRDIFDLYGRKVAAGEWRDYAIAFTGQKAVFSIYRRAAEFPLYRIEKNSESGAQAGAYSVIAATGLILKRGHDLKRVINVLEKKLSLVPG